MKDGKKKKPTGKLFGKKTTKKTTNKSAAKKTEKKNVTEKAEKKAKVKKPIKNAGNKAKEYPKHKDKDELKIGTERPIIINGKAKPKAGNAAQSKAVTKRGRISLITYHIKYD